MSTSKKAHLMFVASSDNNKQNVGTDSNKFIDLWQDGDTFIARYGRFPDDYEFGKSGTQTSPQPIWKWDSYIEKKVRKGYKDMSSVFFTKELSPDTDEGEMYAPIIDDNIRDLVDRLRQYAKEIIAENYTVSATNVTKTQINTVQKVITSLSERIESRNISMLEFNQSLQVELFPVMPRKMKRVSDFLVSEPESKVNYWSELVKNMRDILQKEQSLLDILISQMPDDDIRPETTCKPTVFEALGFSLEPCTDKDIVLIKKKLGKNNSSRLKQAHKIVSPQSYESYINFCKENSITKRDCKLLWHGTRHENVWSILKTGLVLRPSNSVITGKMFGYGIYFAPSSSKSIGYTSLNSSYWAKGTQSTGFLVLNAVAYGNPYKVDSFDSAYYKFNYKKLKEVDKNAHCLHADSSKGMLKNDEIVVYNESQILPLYLVEIGD